MSEDKPVSQSDAASAEMPVEPGPKRRPWQANLAWIVTAALLAVLIWHVHARVDPVLIYHGDLVELPSQQSFLVAPVFFEGSDFLEPFLTRPGGLAERAGAYVFQYFSVPYVGTAILIVLAAVVFTTTNRIVKIISGCPTRYAGFLPALLLVVIWGRYLFHLGDCLALCAALLACEATLRLKPVALRAVLLIVGTAVLYYVIGAPAMLFAGMYGLAELIRRRHWWLGVIGLVLGGAVPFVVGVWGLDATLTDAYARMSGPHTHGLRSSFGASHWVRLAAWLGIYGGALLAVAFGGLKGWWARAQGRREDGPTGPSSVAAVICSIVVIVAACGAVFGAFDADARSILRIHYFALTEQWSELVAETQEHPPAVYSPQAIREVNRALAEEGLLGSRMFAYPQSQASLFGPMTTTFQSVVECRTFMRLGLVNQAENLAAELLTWWGHHPTLLRVLAEVFIIKELPESARVFLHRLSGDVVHGAWARRTLEALKTDPLLSADPEITRHRSMIQNTEVFDLTYSEMLRGLVTENPRKYRMAFEYLMATQLLFRPTNQSEVEGFFGNIIFLMVTFIPEMGYRTLPEHYSEVRALHTAVTGQRFRLEPFRVPEEINARFRQSRDIVLRCRGNLVQADEILAMEMPGSYFRFFVTGQSGGQPSD